MIYRILDNGEEINRIVADERVIAIYTEQTGYTAEPVPVEDVSIEETPSQQRENAYNTDKLIPWNDDTLTVTEAAKLWSYYAAEGDTDTAAELTALIAEAKAAIRRAEVTDP